MTDLKNNIIEKIKAGQVAMKPRWYFVLQTGLWVVALLLVAMIAVYLLSFVFFILHQSGLWLTPSFGWRGLMFFVVSSPGILISLAGFFFLLLYLLVTHFSFSYQKPLVYSLLGTVIFVIGVSSFIQYMMIHERIQSFSERHHLPVFTPLYKGIENMPPEGIAVGIITRFTDTGFEIYEQRGGLVSVIVTSKTKQPKNNKYKVGDQIIVFGKKTNGELEALGIRQSGSMRFFTTPASDNKKTNF